MVDEETVLVSGLYDVVLNPVVFSVQKLTPTETDALLVVRPRTSRTCLFGLNQRTGNTPIPAVRGEMSTTGQGQ